MRRSSSCELRRAASGSRSIAREAVNGKWRVLLSPAGLSSAAVSAVGLFMLVRCYRNANSAIDRSSFNRRPASAATIGNTLT